MNHNAITALLPIVLAAACPLALAQEEAPVSRQTGADLTALADEQSLLTPVGTLIVEASLQYAHDSSTQVAIDGYTILPTLVVGLINVSQLQRDTLTAAVTLRTGLWRRLEAELRLPYVYKEEWVRERELMEGTAADLMRDSSGHGIGDVELALRYQFNGRGNGPYWLGGLRIKSDTGDGPFDVRRRPVTVSDGQGGTEELPGVFTLTEQPRGSGFWAVQPSLAFVLPTDPAVIYGHFSYTWNIERDVGEPYRSVDPGDAIGFGFGLGFAFNATTSYSIGYDHSVVLETDYEVVQVEADFERFQVGTLQFGLTHRLSKASSLSLALGVGVTEYAPDVQIGLRLPMRF